MRRATILLAVLCLALFAAAPAAAFFAGSGGSAEGSLGISGYYELEGEKQVAAHGGTETTWASYSDDFELKVRVGRGNLAGVVDFVIADNSGSSYAGHNNLPVVADDYWVEWAALDYLDFKAGEYELNFGRKIGVYNAGGRNFGAVYRMDAVDLGLTLGKVAENGFNFAEEDQDIEHYLLTASLKAAGPFERLAFAYLMEADQIGATSGSPGFIEDDSYTATFMGLDFAVPAGPVTLSGEFGVKGGERYNGTIAGRPVAADQKGNYFVLEAGLGGLMPQGFGLSVLLFNSSKDYTGPFFTTDANTDEDDYTPLEILFDEINPNEAFTQAVVITGSYAVSDRLTVKAALVPLAQVNGDQADVIFGDYDYLLPPPYEVMTPAESGDSWGTEYDVGIVYKLADNITYTATYARFTEGDVKVGDLTQYYNSVKLAF